MPTAPLHGGTAQCFVLATFLLAYGMEHCCGAGVTVITHGYAGNADGWVAAMATEIPSYDSFPGTNSTTYKVTLTTDRNNNYFYSWEPTNSSPPAVTDSGEIIIKLDWSQMAGGSSAPYDVSTYDVAWLASWVLLQTNSIPALGGHALVEFPIHLIGHSRGGSLVSEISRLLGTNGVWIDHITTLDPHPLNNDGNADPFFPTDAPAKNTYANVLFADNYWQDLGDGLFVPNGEPVSGAYVRQLYNLSGGYSSTHSDVHLWYYGTINLNTPAAYNLDGDTATIDATMRSNWWVSEEGSGFRAGFLYSLIGGGNRLSAEQPLGPGYSGISDGYNQRWDFGAGTNNNRTALSSDSGEWPDLIKLNLTGTNVVAEGDSIFARFYYQYGGRASNVTCEFYFDRDFNTLGSNSLFTSRYRLTNTGIGSVFIGNVGLSTSNTPPGTYALYGKISDGSHTRYLYAPELVQVIGSRQAPLLSIASVNANQLLVSVSGVSGQTLILESSSDLKNWVPVTTNTLSSNPWVYRNNSPGAPAWEFYRAVLSP